MKKLTFGVAVILLQSIIFSSNVQAQIENNINVVTTAVPFIRISPDARAGGMGDVGIATAPDAYSGYWNSGKAVFVPNSGSIAFTYTPWLKDLGLNDIYLAALSGYYRLDDAQTLTGSLRYFNLGSITFTDISGNTLNNFRPREFSLDAGYSRKLSSKIGLGVGLHYISSDLAGGNIGGVSYKRASSVAGDVHFFYKGTKPSGNGLDWGVTLSNLGAKISYTSDASQKDYIPANLGIGAAYNKVFDADNKITFAIDLNKLMVPTPPVKNNLTETEYAQALTSYRGKGVISSWFSSFSDAGSEELKEITVSTGIEYNYKNQFAFRTGYFYENQIKGNRRYFTVGAGLKYNTFGLDFSYIVPTGSGVNRNPLSNTLRFSILFDFNKDKEEK